MAYNGLQQFVKVLEANNQLIRISKPISTELQITEITDRIMKSPDGGKAILFENCGSKFPLLINHLGSTERISSALDCDDLDQISDRIDLMFKEITAPKRSLIDKIKTFPLLKEISSFMPKRKRGKGVCQQVIDLDPDLDKLPILKCWPADGGNFITLPAVITEDPNSEIRNVGMYRMQQMGKNATGMHWHLHKTGERHYQEYKKLGKKMPISVALGGDPAYTFSATAPLPDNIDEFMLAGFIRKKSVKLVKSITNDIYVPEDADIIIEGYVDPAEEKVYEGPFGDHTGFYSLADYYPKFHVTAITHRRDAIYPATIVGIPPMEDAYIQRASERIFLSPMRLVIAPEVLDLDLPPAGVAHNITIVKIQKSFEGQARRAASAMWGAGQMMFNKILITVSSDVDIHNYLELAQIISQKVDIDRDIFFVEGPADVLDHSAPKFTYGSKLGIDATVSDQEYTPTIEKDPEIKLPEWGSARGLKHIGISALIVAIDKDKFRSSDEVHQSIREIDVANSYKFIIVVDKGLNLDNLDSVAWYCSGNIDPIRDCRIKDETIVIDGTRKSRKIDKFKREWPNPVVSSDKTIEEIDQMWDQLKIGEFIKSPSLQYKGLLKGEGAVADE